MRKSLVPVCLVLAATLSLPLVGFGDETASTSESEEATEQRAALEEVPAVKVCMVNDQLFAKDQIPVEVEGKTYFGCCEMCKGRLASDAAIRQATDPLTGESVDKATAVKAADAEGAIFYFATRENFEKFLAAATDAP
jgi:YHS domain-containing protein